MLPYKRIKYINEIIALKFALISVYGRYGQIDKVHKLWISLISTTHHQGRSFKEDQLFQVLLAYSRCYQYDTALNLHDTLVQAFISTTTSPSKKKKKKIIFHHHIKLHFKIIPIN